MSRQEKYIPFNKTAASLMRANDGLSLIAENKYKMFYNQYKRSNPGKSDDEIRELIYRDKADEIKGYKNLVKTIDFSELDVIKDIENLSIVKGLKRNTFTESIDVKDMFKQNTMNFKDFFEEYINYNDIVSGKEQTPHKFLNKVVRFNNKISKTFEGKNVYGTREGVLSSIDKLKNSQKITVFDLETFAGENLAGLRTFGGITEYAFGTYEKTESGSLVELDKNVSIIGFDKKTTDGVINKIRSYQGQDLTNIPNEIKVAMSALGKMGHDNTSFEEIDSKPGLFKFKSYASDEDKGIYTMSNILRGAERYNAIHSIQSSTIGKSGAPTVEEDFINALASSKDNLMVGYNIVQADLPWIDMQLNKMSPAGQEYAKSVLGDTKFDVSPDNYLDVMSAINFYEDIGKRSALDFYKGTDILGTRDGIRRTRKQQSSLVEAVVGEPDPLLVGDLASHSAEYDIAALAQLVSKDDFINQLEEGIKSVESNTSLIDLKNSAFMTTNTQSSGQFYGQGPLSFSYNKKDGSVKTMFGHHMEDITKIKDVSDIRSEHQDFGRKKDSLVRIEDAGKITTSEKFKEMAKGFADNQAINDLYYIDIANITNLEGHKGATDNTVLFFENEDKFNAYMSSLRYVGEKNKIGKYELAKGKIGEQVRKDYARVTQSGDKISIEDLSSFEDLMSYSDSRIVSDSASRNIRGQTYSKAKKFLRLKERVEQDKGLIGISQEELIKNAELARQVSSNKILGEITRDEMANLIGYRGKDGKQVLHQETVDNMLQSWDVLSGMEDINRGIIDYIDNKKGLNITQKNEYYNQIMQGIQSEVLSSDHKNIDKLVDVFQGRGSIDDVAKNLNYINIDTSKILKGVKFKGLGNDPKKHIKVDFNKSNPEYSLINSLIEASGEKHRIKDYNKDIRTLGLLDKTINYLRETDLGDVLETDKYYDENGKFRYKDPASIASLLIDDLYTAKQMKDDPFYGITDTSYLHTMIPTKESVGLINEIIEDKGGINKIVNKVGDQIRSVNSKIAHSVDSENSLKAEASNIVKKTLLSEVGSQDIENTLLEFGYSEKAAKYMKYNIDRTSAEMTEHIASLIGKGSKIGIDFMYDDGTLIANYGSDYVPINLPKLSKGHGGFHTSIGSMDVAYHSVVENKKGDLELGSTITRAFNRTYNPIYGLDKDSDPSDIVGALERYSKDLGAAFRESPVVDASNQRQRMMPFLIDFNETLNKLPEWHSKGYFEGADFIEDNFIKEVLNNPDFDYRKLAGKDRELLAKDLPIAMNYLLENNPQAINDKGLREAIKYTNMAESEKNISANIFTLFNQSIMPGQGRGDNVQRPLLWQTAAAQEFRESHFIDVLDNLGYTGKETRLGDSILTRQMYRTYNKIPEGMSERVQRSVTVRKANMDPINLKLSIAETAVKMVQNNEDGELTDKQRKIFNRISAATTHEDASIGSRLLYELYGHKEKQYITMTDDTILTMDNPLLTDEYLDRLNKITPKIIDKDGQFKFSYGGESLVEKEDVIHRELALDGDGVTPYGSKMELGFMGFKFQHKNTKLEATEEEVQNALNDLLLEDPELKQDPDKALNKLKKQFNSVLYVESAEKGSYYKTLQDGGEKKMTYTPVFGMGEYDDTIAQYMDEHLKDTKAYKLKGKIPTKKALDELIDPHFVATEDFKTPEEFKQAVIDEQMTPTEVFFKNVMKGKVDFVADLNPKHQNKFMEIQSQLNLMAAMVAEEEDVELDVALEIMLEEMEEHDLNPFKMDGVEIRDGSIILPTEHKDGEYIDIGNIAKYASKKGYAEDIIGEDGVTILGQKLGVFDPELNTTISMEAIAKADDFDRGSYSKRREDAAVRIKELQEMLSREQEKPESERSIAVEDSLRYQIEEKKKVAGFFDRKARMGERELGILKQTRVTDNTVSLFQSKIDDGTWDVEQAKNIVGHMFDFDESGITGIKKEYEGSPLAKTMIKNMQHSIFNKYHNTISLSDAIEQDPEKFSYLQGIRSYFEEKGIYADLRTAIEYDELGQSIKAVDFNLNPDKNISDLEKSRFRQIELMDVNLPGTSDADFIERQGDSYLTDNLILDIGEDMEASGKRYLAIPKIDRRSGDQVIKFEHQKALNNLQYRRSELDELYKTHDEDSQEIIDAQAKLMDAYDDVADSLQKDVYSKDGMLSRFATVELDGSYMGKTSSVVNFSLEDIASGKLGNEVTQEKAKELLEAGYDLDELNFASLSKATLDGKTLMEHAEEGNMVGASFLSEEAFEDMGFFSDNYLRKVSSAKGETVTREDMIEMLETEGVTALSERYPAIDTGSVIPQNIYLSNELSGNMIKVTAEQQMAMHGDNDGDLQRAAILRDSSGKDSILASLSGSTDNTFAEARAMQYHQTFGVTEVWKNAVDDKLQQEFDRSLEGGILQITQNDELNKRLSANVDNSMSYSGFMEHSNKWQKIEDGILDQFETIKDPGEITPEMIDQYISGIKDEEIKEDILQTSIDHLQIVQNQGAAMAKYKKLSIGEANIPNYQLRRFADIKLDQGEWDEKDVFGIQALAYEGEQAVISSKNTLATYANTNRDYLEALDSAIQEGDGSLLKDWLSEHIDEDKLTERVELGKAQKLLEEDFTEEDLIDLFVDRVSSIDAEAKQGLDYLSRAGASKFGLSSYGLDKMASSIVEEDDSLEAIIMKSVTQTHDMEDTIDLSQTMSDLESSGVGEAISDNALAYMDSLQEMREQPKTSEMILESLGSVHQGVKQAFAGMDGRMLAIGAVGLAAGTMAIGSIIGNPTHGYDESREPIEGDLYSDSSLMDDDLNAYGRQQQGYIINVNARSRGSKREVQRAVSTAVASGETTDINISMNINDNTQEITEKYIQDMLSSSL